MAQVPSITAPGGGAQPIILALTKSGLSSTHAAELSRTINTHIAEWKVSGKELYQKKQGAQGRTFQFVPENGEVYVHLKSKSGGLIGKGGVGKVTRSIAATTGTIVAHKVVQKSKLNCFSLEDLIQEGRVHQAL